MPASASALISGNASQMSNQNASSTRSHVSSIAFIKYSQVCLQLITSLSARLVTLTRISRRKRIHRSLRPLQHTHLPRSVPPVRQLLAQKTFHSAITTRAELLSIAPAIALKLRNLACFAASVACLGVIGLVFQVLRLPTILVDVLACTRECLGCRVTGEILEGFLWVWSIERRREMYGEP